ncbi:MULTISPECIES: YshB family small membrane protein [Erwinia]|uniref:YshB family small membrane protein n=1 Tax=Erwinia papayae TaxID=206499 RepID=A0ABV3N640_9GAMM|nr:YshB family small membrane protein [Erwinia mallotivora]
MLESVIHFITQTAQAWAHSPQTAIAAVMCALMMNLFS